jgi:V8-like Glu-specific endopeptidase
MACRPALILIASLAALAGMAGAQAASPLWQRANVFGDDQRLEPAATTFFRTEGRLVSGIGKIACAVSGGSWQTTAFQLGSYHTVVTNAHAFRADDGTHIPARSCAFVMYYINGWVRETVAIDHVKSRWDEGMEGDITNDVAIVRLVSETRTPVVLPAYHLDYALREGEPVTIAGYPGDLGAANRNIIRRVHGRAWRAPADAVTFSWMRQRGIKLNSPQNLAVADYDTAHGTSGSPVYNAAGEVIGIHQGAHGNGGVFNPKSNYNKFLLFDARFKRDMDYAVNNPPPPPKAPTGP